MDIFNTPTAAIQHLMGDFFLEGKKDIQRLFGIAVAAEMFTGKSDCQFDHLQDQLFFFTYMLLLNLDRQDSLEITGYLPLDSVIFADYDLDEVRKYFADSFVETKVLMAAF